MTYRDGVLTVTGTGHKIVRGAWTYVYGLNGAAHANGSLISLALSGRHVVLDALTPDNHHVAVGLASIPEKIRGFGHVKLRHLKAAKADEAALLDQFRAGIDLLRRGGLPLGRAERAAFLAKHKPMFVGK